MNPFTRGVEKGCIELASVTIIDKDRRPREVMAKDGQSLMEAAILSGVSGINADCGGAGLCATCHVYIIVEGQGGLPPISETEAELLTLTEDRKSCSRLSCFIRMSNALSGMVVQVPSTLKPERG